MEIDDFLMLWFFLFDVLFDFKADLFYLVEIYFIFPLSKSLAELNDSPLASFSDLFFALNTKTSKESKVLDILELSFFVFDNL